MEVTFEYIDNLVVRIYNSDLRPDDVKNLPCLNLNLLSKEVLTKLSKAYMNFIESDGTDKMEIDAIVMKGILRLRKGSMEKLAKEKESLKLLASISSGKSLS